MSFTVWTIIIGIGIVSTGVYIVISKNIFGKDELGELIVEALNLSEKGRKRVSVTFGIIGILAGLYLLCSVALYPSKTIWFIPLFPLVGIG